jgi:alkyl sulfatase BDS1-like metallo-beta-lactamase superfamily hydrolase
MYLAGAYELRNGAFGTPVKSSPDMLRALTVPQVFDSIGIRIDGPRAWDVHVRIVWVITDDGKTTLAELRNGVLNHRVVDAAPPGVTTFTSTRLVLIGLVTGQLDLAAALGDGSVTVDGDPAELGSLVGLLAPVDPDFNIVTP